MYLIMQARTKALCENNKLDYTLYTLLRIHFRSDNYSKDFRIVSKLMSGIIPWEVNERANLWSSWTGHVNQTTWNFNCLHHNRNTSIWIGHHLSLNGDHWSPRRLFVVVWWTQSICISDKMMHHLLLLKGVKINLI